MAEIKRPNILSKIPLISPLLRGIHRTKIDLALILLLALPQEAGTAQKIKIPEQKQPTPTSSPHLDSNSAIPQLPGTSRKKLGQILVVGG